MIYLASDHAGFELKEKITAFLKEKGLDVQDIGPHQLDRDDDYPDFIFPAAKKVAENSANKGVIFGKSGQGEAVVANKVKGIRAVVYYGYNEELITLTREHNDANILSIGAGFVSVDEAKKVVENWLNTDFTNEERHVRRIEKIKKIESNG